MIGMRVMSGLRRRGQVPHEAWPAPAVYAAMAAATVSSAVIGAWAIDPDSAWYDSLAKPSWQPPRWVFPVVWPPLYGAITWAGGRSLLKSPPQQTGPLVKALAFNLALNSAFGWSFFKARTPLAGVAVTLALSGSCWDLVRRTAHADRAASSALVPYASWCTFAAALNARIWRLNR